MRFLICLFIDIDTILRLNNESLPTYEEDFVGAAAGLFRLQETYAISAYDMAEGTIRGTFFLLLFAFVTLLGPYIFSYK